MALSLNSQPLARPGRIGLNRTGQAARPAARLTLHAMQSSAKPRLAGEALDRALLDAHGRAVELFDAIQARDLLVPGKRESEVNQAVFELTATKFGTRRHWHKRLVRVGSNTIHPIYVDTADVEIAADDIGFIDLGPVFDHIEADFARTYVLGDDPEKLKLAAVLPRIFDRCKAEFRNRADDITGAQLYEFVCRTCEEHGYVYGNTYCAHLLGEFAHKQRFGMDAVNFAQPGNDTPMTAPAPGGEKRHWVLEIHILQDPAIGTYGGFYEDLLTL